MAVAGTVFLHFGQCGAQLGEAFWSAASSELGGAGGVHDARRPLFDGSGAPRCVVVDTDSKVVRRFEASVGGGMPSSCVVSGEGSGVRGFVGSRGDATRAALLARVGEGLRKQAEQLDVLQSIVTTHGLGGGTGSVVCGDFLEYLRDDLSFRCVCRVCRVWRVWCVWCSNGK